MKLLDLFCGAGGCSMGYYRAGFKVVGVDINPQPHYPFDFIQGNALSIDIDGYDVIHASPPCQAYTIARNNGQTPQAADLIAKIRYRLIQSGKPFVIENVAGSPLQNAFMLCGASFGLGVAGFDLSRHRFFESNVFMLAPPCQHKRGQTIGVYGGGTNQWHKKKFGRCVTMDENREAMGIDWMVRKELSQAIPPAYTEWIGKQIIKFT